MPNVLEGTSLFSNSEIAQKLGWNKDKTIPEINKLLNAGYIRKVGTGRRNKYAI